MGTVTFTQAKGKNYVYYTSEGADEGALDASVAYPSDALIATCIEKQNARIKVNNGTVTVGDTTEAQLDSFKGQKGQGYSQPEPNLTTGSLTAGKW